jgi:hypothetical protein
VQGWGEPWSPSCLGRRAGDGVLGVLFATRPGVADVLLDAAEGPLVAHGADGHLLDALQGLLGRVVAGPMLVEALELEDREHVETAVLLLGPALGRLERLAVVVEERDHEALGAGVLEDVDGGVQAQLEPDVRHEESRDGESDELASARGVDAAEDAPPSPAPSAASAPSTPAAPAPAPRAYCGKTPGESEPGLYCCPSAMSADFQRRAAVNAESFARLQKAQAELQAKVLGRTGWCPPPFGVDRKTWDESTPAQRAAYLGPIVEAREQAEAAQLEARWLETLCPYCRQPPRADNGACCPRADFERRQADLGAEEEEESAADRAMVHLDRKTRYKN